MAFANVSLLLGTLLVGVPIALHLLMRRRPRHIVFPAIQFIRKHQETNRRTLHVRQWSLLILRCLALVLAALALTRVSVSSAVFGQWLIIGGLTGLFFLIAAMLIISIISRRSHLVTWVLGAGGLLIFGTWVAMLITTLSAAGPRIIGDREAPVASVMIFDSSPRMAYHHENRTRLEQAQQTANWLVGRLPPDSKVAVIDSRAITPVFSIDISSARDMIRRVTTTGAPRSLEQLLETAIRLTNESAQKRKEIYLFSDLSETAWQMDDPVRLRRLLEQADDVALYIVDVGVEHPQNFSLGNIALSASVVPENGTLDLRTSLSCMGSGGDRVIEVQMEEIDPTLPVIRDGKVIVPKATVRGRREISVPEDGTSAIEFHIQHLELGSRNGSIRLVGNDALPMDDIRYFTIQVRPPWLVLVVAPPNVNTSAFVEAISPYELQAEHRARFDCLTIRPEEITKRRLSDFAAIVLLDPPPLSGAAWQQMGQYVRAGGGLAVFLGHHAQGAQAFNARNAIALLPGKLGRLYRVTGRDTYISPDNYNHPILQPFRSIASSVPWNQFPVFRHWSLRDLDPETQVILRFGNRQPALLQRDVGKGTVLMMTTPVTELDRPKGRQPWNELAGPDDWPRFILVNQITMFLTERGIDPFNFETGQRVVLSNPESRDPHRYVLFTPDGETQPVQARDDRLVIPSTDLPGTYRLKGQREGPVVRGFSVNIPDTTSRLQRISIDQLDAILGPDRYQLARDRDQIFRQQGQQREGREFYSMLIVTLVLILVFEQLLANRFYRTPRVAGTS